MSHFLYTTIRPDQLLEVDAAERADLAAQGLILTEIDPGSGEVAGGAPHVPADTVSHVPTALDAAETLADDQPAAEADSSGG